MNESSRNRAFALRWNALNPLRILFPPHPPPLGVLLNFDANAYEVGAPPDQLRAEVLEPFFAPLSTRLIERDAPLGKAAKRRLEDYQKLRAPLLAELRRTIQALIPADGPARLAEFSRLAQAQDAKLQKLEAQAEKLRAELARGIGWSDVRTWQLGSGDLDRPRPENRTLEHQVLRAAAFYQEGLSPAQRRLVREAGQILQETVFRDDDDAPTPTKLFPFFSPDLARVPAPPGMPPALATRFDRYVSEKDALRRELQDAIYENDELTEHARTRALQRLGKNQFPRLADLEKQAETIRVELALLPSAWRRPPPPMLPPERESQISEFLDLRCRLQRECEDFVRPVAASPPPAQTQNDPEARETWKEQRRTRTQAASDEFLEIHADELHELSRQCHALYAALQPYLRPDEVPLGGDPLDVSVMEFIRRYQRDIGYYEYDLAAFEPGLSPEQRRLLLAEAIIRLELPLPAPERQAVAAPKTLLH